MIENREEFEQTAIELGVPRHTAESLTRYVFDGVPPGQFLEAVLSNDLMESFARADDENTRNIRYLAAFIYNELPGNSHGTLERMVEWMKERRENATRAFP